MYVLHVPDVYWEDSDVQGGSSPRRQMSSDVPFYRKRKPQIKTLDNRKVEDGRATYNCSTVAL